MTSSFAEKLRSGFPNLTKSEKAVAKRDRGVDRREGVSSMTVSRFLRGLGYNGLSELKEQLRTELELTPLLISDRLARIRKASKRDSKLWENFDLEIMATLGVYELLGGTVWKRAVEALAESSTRCWSSAAWSGR